MKTIVFLGPSLPRPEAKLIYPEAIYRAPVACGDILKCLEESPDRIVIVDGFFYCVAAVWHKEILYALSMGVEVFGASSMGALRAAELYHFGMIGSGKIFEQYKNNELNDDDEVAVMHASSESGYVAITDAMVNIRATLKLAFKEGVVTHDEKQCLLYLLKKTYFQKRQLLVAAKSYYKSRQKDASSILTWLRKNYVDQKSLDCRELLAMLSRESRETTGKVPCHLTASLTRLMNQKTTETFE